MGAPRSGSRLLLAGVRKSLFTRIPNAGPPWARFLTTSGQETRDISPYPPCQARSATGGRPRVRFEAASRAFRRPPLRSTPRRLLAGALSEVVPGSACEGVTLRLSNRRGAAWAARGLGGALGVHGVDPGMCGMVEALTVCRRA